MSFSPQVVVEVGVGWRGLPLLLENTNLIHVREPFIHLSGDEIIQFFFITSESNWILLTQGEGCVDGMNTLWLFFLALSNCPRLLGRQLAFGGENRFSLKHHLALWQNFIVLLVWHCQSSYLVPKLIQTIRMWLILSLDVTLPKLSTIYVFISSHVLVLIHVNYYNVLPFINSSVNSFWPTRWNQINQIEYNIVTISWVVCKILLCGKTTLILK